MNYQKTFLFTIISLQIFSSCQDDIKELDNTNSDNKLTLLSTKSRDDDIDGGTLPEVVVTANRLEYASDFDGSGGGSYANPPQVTLSANLLKLFPKGSNLGESDLEKLNAEYKRC